MKRNFKRLTSIALAMLLTISGGVSFTDFKINNVQEVYAQTSSNVKFIPNVDYYFEGPNSNTVGNRIVSLNISQSNDGVYRLYIDTNGNVIAKFKVNNEIGDWENYKYYGDIIGDKIITKNKYQETDTGEYGLVDTKGNMLIPYKYQHLEWASDDILRFWEGSKNEDGEWDYTSLKVGLVDITGKVIVPAGKYVEISDFSDGYATAYIGKKQDKNGDWVEFDTVFIDKTGKEHFGGKIPLNSGASSYSKEGIVGAKDPNAKDKNKPGGYLDLNSNKFIIPGQFVNCFPFNNGIARVTTNKYENDVESYNYVDKTGKKLLPTDYEKLFAYFSPEGYTLGKPKGKNEVHILSKSDLSKPYGIIKDADFQIYDDSSSGELDFLRVTGQTVKLSNYLPFSVTINDALDQVYGFADLKGNVVIEPIFSTATALQNNKAFAFVNGDNEEAKAKGLKPGVYILDFSKGVPTIENMKNAQVLDVSKVNGTVQPVSTDNKAATKNTTNTKTATTQAPAGSITYKVQKWDTLGNISLRNYGSYAYHKELYNINKNAFAKTKGKLVPGMEIILPAKIGNATRLAPLDTTKGKIHTVQKGETLGTISNKYYKTPSKYNVIFEANKDRIKKPNMIYEGQQIIIPNVK